MTFHEAAHGFVALRFGDDTALRARRVTFNPFNHIDPFGTILLPALLLLGSGGRFLFGYAKPVPVNFGRLRDPRHDMVWVALAGPGTNVLLAIASSLLFYGVVFFPPSPAEWIAANLVHSLQINAALCVFNMLPLPPLDGGRVAVGLLPRPLAYPLARARTLRHADFVGAAVRAAVDWRPDRGQPQHPRLRDRRPDGGIDRVRASDYRASRMSDDPVEQIPSATDKPAAIPSPAGRAGSGWGKGEDRRPPRPEQLVLDLDGYEGPIDLLLSLAREQKVDLTKISILALADQYLALYCGATTAQDRDRRRLLGHGGMARLSEIALAAAAAA